MKFLGLFRFAHKKIDDAVSAKQGFTLVELLVSLAIIVAISAQVLVSFSGTKEASTFTRAAQEVAFNVRRAQNMSLSVTGVPIQGVGTEIPVAVGIRLSSNAGENERYFFFADQNSNGVYDVSNERIEPDILLPSGIRIQSVAGELPAPKGVHIIFYTPEATLRLTNGAGEIIWNYTDVVLVASSGATKTVRVRTSGQITILP